jgi:DNA-directed RNA polymerase specialized sigma24 family protein
MSDHSEAFDLFSYPDAPGHRGIDTSVEAAAAMSQHLGRLQDMAFNAIKAAGALGLTADELAERLGVNRYTIQPRTSELRRLRKIADSGQRRRNVSGKKAIVWTLPEHVLPVTGGDA